MSKGSSNTLASGLRSLSDNGHYVTLPTRPSPSSWHHLSPRQRPGTIRTLLAPARRYLASRGIAQEGPSMSRTASAQQVPANLSATETLFEAVIGGQRISRFVSDGLDHLVVETATPVRSFFAWKGKRNYEGRYFSATTGGHVVFESHLERDYLISVDADSVPPLASQTTSWAMPSVLMVTARNSVMAPPGVSVNGGQPLGVVGVSDTTAEHRQGACQQPPGQPAWGAWPGGCWVSQFPCAPTGRARRRRRTGLRTGPGCAWRSSRLHEQATRSSPPKARQRSTRQDRRRGW